MSREYCVGPVTRAEKAEAVIGRLLSDEAVEAAAMKPSELAGSDASYWHELDEDEKQVLRAEAAAMLQAALKVAKGKP